MVFCRWCAECIGSVGHVTDVLAYLKQDADSSTIVTTHYTGIRVLLMVCATLSDT